MTQKHWANSPEKGSRFALKLTLFGYRLLGHKVTLLLMRIIMLYFYLFAKTSRQASKNYLTKLRQETHSNQSLSSYKHFCHFGESIIDKLAVYHQKICVDDVNFPNAQLLIDKANKKQGFIIFTAHLGNIEIARALSNSFDHIKINALVSTEHAQKINHLFKQINPQYDINLIHLQKVDIALAMSLQQKIDQGEIIIIAADRTSVNQPEKCTPISFLGKDAYFPQGPFILAHLLHVESYFMLCLKNHAQQFNLVFEPFAQSIHLPRSLRNKALTHYSEKYAQLLEKYCKLYPYQWFNFFNFWQKPKAKKTG